jgi:hypothetical protein
VVQKTIKFFLFSNIFIALGATITTASSSLIFNIKLPITFYVFMFLATLCSYNMHWYFTTVHSKNTQREIWSLRNKNLLLILTVASAVATLYLISTFSKNYIWYILPLVIASIIYTAPKTEFKIFEKMKTKVIGKTIYLTLAWLYATVALPLLLGNIGWNENYSNYFWHRLFVILPICLLFDYKDKEIDIEAGIKSILKFASTGLVKYLVQIFLTLSVIYNLNLINKISDLYWCVNFLPIFLLMFLYKKTSNTSSDVWYYGIVDGLMFVSALLIVLLKVLKI